MIKLYSFGPAFSVMDASPFVVKVDLFMRMANLPYELVADMSNLKKAPKGKLPFIEDKGLKVADSHHIIAYLTKSYNVKLDDFLTDEQKAQATMYTKTLDECLYWCLVYSRWAKEETWPLVNTTFFGAMPAPLKWFVPNMIRKDVIKTLKKQGTGRHSDQEILSTAEDIFSALSVLLAEKNYFFGDKMSTFDIVAYSMLVQFICVDYDNDFNRQARKYENLGLFCQRIEQEYYPSAAKSLVA